MARPGYLSIYADDKMREIFDQFVKIKGKSKSQILTEMLEVYMLSADEELYLQLRKEALNIDFAKNLILERLDNTMINDFIFSKLTHSYNYKEEKLSGEEVIAAYRNNLNSNNLGYTWFSTSSLHSGMSSKKVRFYNEIIKQGQTVKLLIALPDPINDICYSATVKEILSNKSGVAKPEEVSSVPVEFHHETTKKIWLKLTSIDDEENLKASMLKIRTSDANLKTVIMNSRYQFGYVYLPGKQE